MAEQAGRDVVLFDFDGTLVHLETDYARLRADLERMADEAGIERDGRTIYDLSLLLTGDRRADQAVARAELLGLRSGHELPVGLGLYREYAAGGAELAVVTHNSREVVEEFFRERELPTPVAIFDRRTLGARKAESQVVAEYAGGASSVVVVGDSEFDRALAKRLGAAFVDATDELRAYYESRAGELDELALTYEHPEPYKRFFYGTRFQAVLSALDPQAGDEILDLGCGSGLYTRVLAERGATVTATEFAPTSLALAKRNVGWSGKGVDFRLEDAQALSLPGERFDKVLLTEVIEHIPHPNRAIAEAARVLRPGGVLAVSTPSRFSPLNLAYDLKRRVRRYGFNEHLHEFTPAAFRRLLEGRFEVERFEFANYLLPYPADELYLRLGSPGLGLLERLERTLSRLPVLRLLGWTMVIRARKAA
jgi:2-polyprenyl-3-methyl-5-hydroxy-6-metoxy-1,4-benzoquinol methylase